MNGQIGYDAWLHDDTLATGKAAAYRMQFSDEYFGVVFLPQTGKEIMILGLKKKEIRLG